MRYERFPDVGDKRYYMHREVSILKVWDCVHLMEVVDSSSSESFYIDVCTLSNEPDWSCSISMRSFSGG